MYEKEEALGRIAEGVAAFADVGEDKVDLLRRVVAETLSTTVNSHASIASAVGAEAPKCRITRITSIDCGAGEVSGGGIVYRERPPIASGPNRAPIAWGGSACVTVFGCTICYEYECTAELAAG